MTLSLINFRFCRSILKIPCLFYFRSVKLHYIDISSPLSIITRYF